MTFDARFFYLGFLIAYAVKLSLFPFHTCLPDNCAKAHYNTRMLLEYHSKWKVIDWSGDLSWSEKKTSFIVIWNLAMRTQIIDWT